MAEVTQREKIAAEIAFEAGRQSVLQGGVVVPRELAARQVRWATYASIAYGSSPGGLYAEDGRQAARDADEFRALLAGSTPENGETT